MFEVGFSELLLIMGLALLVLGPEKLPKVVTEIGRWMGRARAMARQFREQLEVEAAESARRKTPPTNEPPAVDPSNSAGHATTPEATSTSAPSQPDLAPAPDDERRAP